MIAEACQTVAESDWPAAAAFISLVVLIGFLYWMVLR